MTPIWRHVPWLGLAMGAVTLWFCFNGLAAINTVLQSWLGLPVHVHQMQLTELQADGLSIGTLDVQYQQSKHPIRITADDIQIKFAPSTKLPRQISQLDVANLRLSFGKHPQHTSPAKPPATASLLGDLAKQTPRHLLSQLDRWLKTNITLPVNKARIANITLSNAPAPLPKTVSATLNWQQKAPQSTLLLTLPQYALSARVQYDQQKASANVHLNDTLNHATSRFSLNSSTQGLQLTMELSNAMAKRWYGILAADSLADAASNVTLAKGLVLSWQQLNFSAVARIAEQETSRLLLEVKAKDAALDMPSLQLTNPQFELLLSLDADQPWLNQTTIDLEQLNLATDRLAISSSTDNISDKNNSAIKESITQPTLELDEVHVFAKGQLNLSEATPSLQLHYQVQADKIGTFAEGFTSKGQKLGIAGNFAYDAQRGITLAKGTSLQFANWQLADQQIAATLLHSTQATTLSQTASGWQITKGNWRIPRLRLSHAAQQQTLTLQEINISHPKMPANSLTAYFSLGNVDARWQTLATNWQQIRGHIRHREQKNSGKFSLRHNLSSRGIEGVFTVTDALDFTLKNSQPWIFTNQAPLSDFVSPWPWPLDFTNGMLNWQLTGRLGEQLQTTLQAELNNIHGKVSQYPFVGLSSKANLQLTPSLYTRDSVAIKLQSANVGIALTDIHGRVRIPQTPRGRAKSDSPLDVLVDDFSVALLGGTLSMHQQRYSHGAKLNQLTPTLKDINLAELVALNPVAGLVVDGRISGDIPLTIQGTTVSLDQGVLHNSKPGQIRYENEQLLSQQGLTRIAVDALREFNYEVLEISTKFATDGTLNADFKLQGNSPYIDSDRPVHLNISTEQNIFDLLASLRYAEGLETQLSE